LSTATPPAIPTAVVELCQSVRNESGQATADYNKLKAAVNKFLTAATRSFPHATAYINNPAAESAFVAGGTTCEEFFIGLKAAFAADLKSDGLPAPGIDALITVYINTLATDLKG